MYIKQRRRRSRRRQANETLPVIDKMGVCVCCCPSAEEDSDGIVGGELQDEWEGCRVFFQKMRCKYFNLLSILAFVLYVCLFVVVDVDE